MEQAELDGLRAWFFEYIRQFYGDEEYVNDNLRLKEEHTKRTCEEMLYLAGEVGLSEGDVRVAEAVALLHDVARFVQFVRCRTYVDTKCGMNHGRMGMEILKKEGVLEGIDGAEREVILRAVEYHGVKDVPGELDERTRLFCGLIRDADKLDIYQLMVTNWRQYRDDPENFRFEVEIPDEPYVSEEVAADVLAGGTVDYAKLRTWNDMKLVTLGWVYDVTFAATLRRIKQRRYLEDIIDLLPDIEQVQQVAAKVLADVEERIRSEK
jgi:hypothetical protein